MTYSSTLGSILYYDNVSHRSSTCDTTMLFLFGLESMIASDKALSAKLFIPKYVKQHNSDEVQLLEVYDTIIEHLSNVGNCDVFNTFLNFDCKGAKLFVNSLSGNDSDRTVPIVYHSINDVVDLLDDITLSNYELISNIFNYAGYSVLPSNIGIISESSIKKPRRSEFSTDDDYNAALVNYNANIQSLRDNNNALRDEYNKKLTYGKLYKYIDYKAMYSYSLGVLYGCRCLGYDDSLIWNLNPTSWYDGIYTELVNTAWQTFRFRYDKPIKQIDSDKNLYRKYKGIQPNKIWNYEEESHSHVKDAVQVICVDGYTFNNILYSPTKEPDIETALPYLGTYFDDDSDKWLPVQNKITQTSGILEVSPTIRYVGKDSITIYRSYKYNNSYLSPNNRTHYTITANIGWSLFDEQSYKNFSSTASVPTISPTSFTNLPISSENDTFIGWAVDRDTNTLVTYYKCYYTDNKPIYCIFEEPVTFDGVSYIFPPDSNFKYILSELDFTNEYSLYDTSEESSDYHLEDWYNLSDKVTISIDSTGEYVFNGYGVSPKKIDSLGYTITPSVEVLAYTYTDGNRLKYDLRYNKDLNKYWSLNWSLDETPWKDTVSQDLYLKIDSITLYSGENILKSNVDVYSHDIYTYIFNDLDIDCIESFYNSFMIIDDNNIENNLVSLYDVGITTYKCNFVLVDDDGNSLLDEFGNPTVWYDNNKELYWNNTFKVWQSSKPHLSNKYMYDTSDNSKRPVYDNEGSLEIYINGVPISYSEFYNNNSYGIIRSSTYVFNSTVDESVVECFVDNYSNKYCIPNITSTWVYRSSITDLGYRFVDGITNLYLGSEKLNVIFDNNPID